MTKPSREDYKSRSEYRWATKNWKRSHGGSLIAGVIVALVLSAITGSTAVFFIAVAVFAGLYVYGRLFQS